MLIKRKFTLAFAAATIAASPFLAIPAAEASTATTQSVVVVARAYTVTVKCQLVRISPNETVGYIYGTGSGSNYTIALNNAKRDADTHVPQGYYKRHCYAI